MRSLRLVLCCLLLASAAMAAEDRATLVRRALEAREAGRLDDSIGLYRRALEMRQIDPESWWYQGLNFYDLDRYAEAEEAFRRVTEQARENGPAMVFLGLCEFQTKKYTDAFAHLVIGRRKGIPADSELDRVAHYHYVMLANRIGQFELADGLLVGLADKRPETHNLVEMAGLSALRMPLLPSEIPAGKRDRVLLAGRAAVLAWQKRFAEAMKLADELLEKHPEQANVHYLRGYIYMLQQSDQSVEEFEKELAVSPRHVQARLQIALQYLQRGDAKAGLPYAAKAAELAPDDFTARTINGRLLLEEGRLEEAIRHLERAVKLAPTSPDAHFHLANAYSQTGRGEEAARHRKYFRQLDAARKKEP